MTNPVNASLYSLGAGSVSSASLGATPIVSKVAPSATNVKGPNGPFKIGQNWVDSSANTVYVLTSLSSSGGLVSATWTATQSAGTLLTLSGDNALAVGPDGSGNIAVLGTAGQVTTTSGGNTVTISIPTTMVVPGSLEVVGFFQADAGATIKTAGTALNLATDNDTAQVNIGTGTSGRTIDIGTSAAANLVNIGSNTGASSLSLKFGTGNASIAGATTATILVGATAQTGTITLGSSSGTSTVLIGNGAGASTVNIANAGTAGNAVNIATAAGANAVIIGSTNTTSATTLRAGSGGITLTGATGVTGALTVSTSITATLGAITATNGNLVLGTAGNKILSTSVATTTTAGANSFGSVTLASGTATVATSAVTSSSLIVVWRQGVGASTALGEISVGTIVNATSFVVYAATVGTPGTPLATDASVVGWMIIN